MWYEAKAFISCCAQGACEICFNASQDLFPNHSMSAARMSLYAKVLCPVQVESIFPTARATEERLSRERAEREQEERSRKEDGRSCLN